MILRIPPEHFSSVYAEPVDCLSAQFVSAKTREGLPITGWVTSSLARIGDPDSYHAGKIALPFRVVSMMPGMTRTGRPVLAGKLATSIGKLFVEITGRHAATLVFERSRLVEFNVSGIDAEKITDGLVMFGANGFNELKQTNVH